MDQLFIDQLDFTLPKDAVRNVVSCAPTMAEALRRACELVGIELLEYDSGHFVTMPRADTTMVTLRSKAWRDRVQR